MTDDGWEKVAAAPADDGWEPVTPAERPAPVVGEAIPEAFIGRLRAGEALGRVLQAAGKGASEGAGTGTPTGFEDDTLNYLIEKGVFHDPATGRPGPLQMANEAVMIPAAKLWEGITRATSGAIHGAGEAMGQIVDEFGGSQGTANRAKNEVINFGNWAMIEGGMGRFSRPSVEQAAVMDRTVGGLPTPEDFTAAGKVMESPHAEANLRQMWREDGIHPAEAVHDAQSDGFVKNEITAPREEIKLPPETEQVLEETGGKPGSLSAAMTEPGDIPLDVQPPRPPSGLVATAQAAAEKLFDVGRDIQMKLAPMARGSVESMATVKDYMNAMRRNAWDVSRIDTDTMKRFDPEQRARLANAMEEESLSRRLGEPESAREHQGLATLAPEERAFVEAENTRQQLAWLKARDLGMVEGDGIEMHYPRMVVGLPKGLDAATEGQLSLNAIGYDLRSRTPFAKQRKHIELEDTEKAIKAKVAYSLKEQGKTPEEVAAAVDKVQVVRDIRAVNLATKQLEDAVAGRTLVENIKDVGKRTGDETVAVGFKPDDGWFTVDHPSFKQWRPKFAEVDGKVEAVKDSAGNPVFEQVPIYVRGDFEGPLRSAMWGKSGDAYKGMMALKGKTMSYLMNSPMIHNLVEWGRALAAAPMEVGSLRVYFTGNRAKNDVATMHEAIGHGLVPIGKRFFNQDINAVMESPSLTPGRSIEAQAAALIPGLFDEAAGTAVKQAIDKAGDFWHNTMLWDRIADLQAGLYVHFRDSKIAAGVDRDTASYLAARWANQYAGALPKEAMSEAATKFANFAFFSRSFTFGNLSIIKDAFTGLPKDVLAQIERDAGFKAGSIDAAGKEGSVEQAVTSAKSMARRKAMMTIGLEMALLYAGNSVLQSALNVMLGGKTLDQEGHDYIRRFRDVLNQAQTNPLSLLQPFHIAENLSSAGDNEPGRKDRLYVGNAADGTAIYARAPWGKIGEEFTNWFSSPIDMVKKKEGTVMRPAMQILSNDAGFGRKVYDPQAETWPDYLQNAARIAKHLVLSQLPVGQFTAGMDLVRGDGDKLVNSLQLAGPLVGFTFSKGAPGGPAVGEMYDSKSRYQFAVDQALPDIRKQIKRGDVDGAIGRMTELDVPQGLQRYYIKTTLNPALRMSPRAVRDFYLHSTPEQKQRFERARQAPAQ